MDLVHVRNETTIENVFVLFCGCLGSFLTFAPFVAFCDIPQTIGNRGARTAGTRLRHVPEQVE